MNIGQAIEALEQGSKVARSGWNAGGQWLMLQVPDQNSKMRKPYLYIHPVDGQLVPWLASQTDLLAKDWYVVI